MDTELRKAKADLLTGREARRMPTSTMTCRSFDGNFHFAGLASSTDSPYDMGWYTETIAHGAFDATLSKGPDVQLLVNHEGLPLARTTNGSLKLQATSSGLEFEATAPNDDPDAARVAAKVEAKLLDQCSFAFRVMNQVWDGDYTERTITEVSLDRGDVSIVNYGANPNTAIGMRAMLTSFTELSDEQLEEFRHDPVIMAAVERLAPREVLQPLTVDPEAIRQLVEERIAELLKDLTPAPNAGPDLDTFRARAWALKQHSR